MNPLMDCLFDFGFTSCNHPAWTMYPFHCFAAEASLPRNTTIKRCDFCGAQDFGQGWTGGSIKARMAEPRLLIMRRNRGIET